MTRPEHIAVNEFVDVTGHPELLPEGDWFIVCYPDGSAGLAMPRADVEHAARTQPYTYVRPMLVEPPF